MTDSEQRANRILAEVSLLAARFGNVQVDADLTCVVIKRFDLPQDFNKNHATLLIDLGSSYPSFPPRDWYLSRGLRKNGHVSEHYFNSFSEKTYCQQGYAWYSFHIKEWQPNPYSMIKGDNLLTAVQSFYEALDSD
jgi:hypothetical protein